MNPMAFFFVWRGVRFLRSVSVSSLSQLYRFVSQANRISLFHLLPHERRRQRLLSHGSRKFGISLQTCLSLNPNNCNRDANQPRKCPPALHHTAKGRIFTAFMGMQIVQAAAVIVLPTRLTYVELQFLHWMGIVFVTTSANFSTDSTTLIALKFCRNVRVRHRKSPAATRRLDA